MYILHLALKSGVSVSSGFTFTKTTVLWVRAGTSDPYVKFKVDGKTCYRSRTVMRNLNPKWNEKFSVFLEDLGRTIDVRVYDYDRGLRDDWMGSAAIQPSLLQLNVYVVCVI